MRSREDHLDEDAERQRADGLAFIATSLWSLLASGPFGAGHEARGPIRQW